MNRGGKGQWASDLAIRNLSVDFETPTGCTTALRDLSLDVHSGECVAVIGASGSGKSTLALAVLGLLPRNARIRSGHVLWRGLTLLEEQEDTIRHIRGREIGAVFQNPGGALHPDMRVGVQISEALDPPGHNRTANASVALLHTLGVPDAEQWVRRFPHEWSGGMKQRALIAIAIANRPALLVADEPTTALDVTVQAAVITQLRSYRSETGASLLLVTHDRGVVAELADRIVVMDQGQIVEQGPAVRVFDAPSDPRTAELLGGGYATVSARGQSIPYIAEPLVRAVDLRVSFPAQRGHAAVRAVDGVTLELGRGEAVGIVGESGCGKSTLARSLVGLEPNASGFVAIDGTDLGRASKRERIRLRRAVQWVPQDSRNAFNPRRTVASAVARSVRLARSTSRQAAHDRASDLLDEVGLGSGFLSRYPHQLSGGQLQRMAIARALASDPEALILDEPMSALDPPSQTALAALFMKLREERQLSYILITHDLSVVRSLADRTLVMYLGRIVEQGPTRSVFERPRHPYTAALRAALPAPHPSARSGHRIILPANASAARIPEGCGFAPRCYKAQMHCRSARPELVELDGSSDSVVACHYPEA